ncbi:Arsenate-mycothiol transferase ArsC2 [Anatilimnocola aggregata]|uniref:Arsenate-mycothiol transferase ArsC2 n=1 Tax=Anatilimnocola aggregata TaxID=2528021 RepID=A0A517Y6V5_9BACT|nr:arsenate reductase ArsC [Anatilimnocola aggregata]QDU25946.1 Arsenate-mycothiol transferase ArsC2 [Anatilimnocola aggregata]
MRKLKVLFLCTGNSCRSVMGETQLRHIAGDRFEVHSAGTSPKGINPIARQVLEETGVDTDGIRSKHLSEFLESEIDYAIIVCDDAAESCPRAWPGLRNKLLWPFEDPPAFPGTEAEKLNKFREVRDAIRQRLTSWVAELEASGAFEQK